MRSSCARKLQASKLLEGPQYALRDRDFSYCKLGIRDLKAKSRRDSVLKVWAGGGMSKKTPRDYGIEGPYWGPFYFKQRTVRNYRESRHT